jgi:mannose-6-phosphate isomerase-like protein (cupin superfamily)
MEMLKIGKYLSLKNPTPGRRFAENILADEQGVVNLRGMFGLLPPGNQVSYHFHDRRESIIIALSGRATEIVEGKKFPVEANDVLYIPVKEKHGLVNTSDEDFRYLEFFTSGPGEVDRTEVELPEEIAE